MNHKCLAAMALLTAAALAGCGGGPDRIPVYKAAGKITFNNQPVDGAFLVLHPKGAPPSTDVPKPTALVKADGTFEPTTFNSADGAPAGDYVVTIEWRKLVNTGGEWAPGPNLLPAKYSKPETSDLVVHVAEGSNELPPLTIR
jgi:hypothetical protein